MLLSARERPGTDGLIYGVLWVTFYITGFVIEEVSSKSVIDPFVVVVVVG